MTQRKNPRREGVRRQDNGPTWEGGPPNSGSNSTHVAKSRRKWKRRRSRVLRRTGKVSSAKFLTKKVVPEKLDADE